jgi:hypothetical protein
MRKHKSNPNWEKFYRIDPLQKRQGCKRQEKARGTVTDGEKTKKTWQINPV